VVSQAIDMPELVRLVIKMLNREGMG